MACAITSLTPDQVRSQRLLPLWQQYGHSENRLPYVRDETLEEDRCRVRTGNMPRVPTGLCHTVIRRLHMADQNYITTALGRMAVHSEKDLRRLLKPPDPSLQCSTCKGSLT